MSLNLDSPTWTINQVAEFLNCTHWTVRRMISRGEIPAVRIGSMIRVNPADIRKAARPVTNAAELRGGDLDVA